MIKSVRLINFESHLDSLFEFHSGLNVIIGPTDSGKSAVRRGLEWPITNKPGGDAFRSDWGGDTSSEIILGDGTIITRTKGKQNKYEISTHKDPLTGFGTEVPEEIQTAFNINDINLQDQFEPHFLLAKSISPGKVAAHFNQVANLSKIDTGTQRINSEIRKLSNDLKGKKVIKSDLKINLDKYGFLEKFEIELEVLEQEETTHLNNVKRKNKLVKLIANLNEVGEKIQKESRLLKYEKQTLAIEKLIKKKAQQEDRIKSLGHLMDDIEMTLYKLKELKKSTDLEKPITKLTELINSKELRVSKFKELKDLVGNISENQESLLKARKRANKLETEFKANMGDTCLLCNQKIK